MTRKSNIRAVIHRAKHRAIFSASVLTVACLVPTLVGCNEVNPFSLGDVPSFRGLTIPLPPPSYIDDPWVQVDVDGRVPHSAANTGTQVTLFEKVTERGYFTYVDQGEFLVPDVLLDVTNNCMWTYYLEDGGQNQSALAYYKVVLLDSSVEASVCEEDQCSPLDEQGMCACLEKWETGC